MNDVAIRLEQLEGVITLYRSYGIEAGKAMKAIRDEKLWHPTHSSFVAYCENRWQIKKSYAYELINDAETREELQSKPEVSAIAENLNPAQARELSKVEPEQRAEVLQKAAAGGEVTAKSIAEAAKPKREPKPAKVSAVSTAPIDIKAEAAVCVDEMQVAIEDLKVVIDKLGDFEVEPETLEACAEELTKTARLLRRLAKAKTQ